MQCIILLGAAREIECLCTNYMHVIFPPTQAWINMPRQVMLEIMRFWRRPDSLF